MSSQPSGSISPPAAAAVGARLEQARQALLDGRYADTEQLCLRLIADCQALGDRQGEAEAALVLGRLCGNMRRRAEAIDWTRRVLALGAGLDDEALNASAWALQASALAEDDRPAEAVLAVDEAIRRVRPEMPALSRRLIYTCLLLTYRALGMYEQALAASRQAMAVSEGDALRFWSLVNHCATGLDAMDPLSRPDDGAAQALCAELLALEPELARLARTLGTPFARMRYCELAGCLLARLGRLGEARLLLDEAVRGQPDATVVARRDVRIRLAEVLQQLGEADMARGCAQEALDLSAQIPVPYSSRELLRRCELHALLGDFGQAYALSRQHHAKTVGVLFTALNAQIAELSARVTDQAMRLEIAELHERNRGLAHRVREVGEQALTDGLTGVANRRGFERAFAELAGASRPFALALLDIDHFKRVNDEHSHLVGDGVLRRCAQLLADSLRAPDCVARYGGEEFAILLNEPQAQAAHAVIERLRQLVQGHDWSAMVPGRPITISAGLVIVAPGEGMGPALARADAMLYRAKHGGRNRVEASTKGME